MTTVYFCQARIDVPHALRVLRARGAADMLPDIDPALLLAPRRWSRPLPRIWACVVPGTRRTLPPSKIKAL